MVPSRRRVAMMAASAFLVHAAVVCVSRLGPGAVVSGRWQVGQVLILFVQPPATTILGVSATAVMTGMGMAMRRVNGPRGRNRTVPQTRGVLADPLLVFFLLFFEIRDVLPQPRLFFAAHALEAHDWEETAYSRQAQCCDDKDATVMV